LYSLFHLSLLFSSTNKNTTKTQNKSQFIFQFFIFSGAYTSKDKDGMRAKRDMGMMVDSEI